MKSLLAMTFLAFVLWGVQLVRAYEHVYHNSQPEETVYICVLKLGCFRIDTRNL